MTEQQKRVYDFIRSRLVESPVAPSFEEIGQEIGTSSKSSVHRLVSALVDQGLIIRRPGRARSIALAGLDLSTVPTEALVAELGKRGLIRG